MTGCMGDEVGQTSSISMAFMLEVILRSNRSVFNDHITVKFVLKLFHIYITLHHPKMVKLEYGIVDVLLIIINTSIGKKLQKVLGFIGKKL